jgi:hypothetical protein
MKVFTERSGVRFKGGKKSSGLLGAFTNTEIGGTDFNEKFNSVKSRKVDLYF